MSASAIVVRFLADSKQLTKGVDDAAKQVGGFGGRMEELSHKVSNAGKKLTVGVTLPMVALGKVAFDAASDLSESMNKVSVVFGNNAADIQKWSSSAATSLGISKQQALEAAGTFGNLFSAMGIATPKAADMSKEMVGLASDLASFNNANPEEVLLALRSGLVGETEPLRKFGVNLTAARVEAEAFALGLAAPTKNLTQIKAAQLDVEKATGNLGKAMKSHGKDSLEAREAQVALDQANEKLTKSMEGQKVELTAAQKAQAAYSIIMKDTTVAQGDFSNTADGAANKQKILKAQFKDAAATLGTQLLPVGQKILGFLSGLFEKFSKLSPEVQKFILIGGGIAAALGPVLGVFGKLIGSFKKIMFVFNLLKVAFLANPFTLIIAAVLILAYIIIKNWDTIKEVTEKVWNAITGFLSGVWEGIKAVASTVFEWLKNLFLNFTPIGIIIKHWDDIKNFLSGLWEGIKETATTVFNFLKELFLNFTPIGIIMEHWDEIKNFLSGLWDEIKEKAGVVFNFLKELFLNFTPIGLIIQHWETIKTKLGEAWDWLKTKFEEVWEGIKSAFKGAVNFLIGIANNMIGSWEGLLNTFVKGLNKAAELANKVLPGNPIPTLPTVTLPRIPELARGGIVTKPTIALIGEKGPEAVVPLHGNGGRSAPVIFEAGAFDINVHSADGKVDYLTMDKLQNELSKMVRELAIELRVR